MATQPPTPYASASLYVGDLAADVTEALLFEIFNAVGPVASVRVCRDASTRRSLGYAYVNFHRVEDAERALDTMNFKQIRSRPCRIMWSHRDPSLRKSGRGNIFVKNLAPTIDNKSLYDTFSMFGNILSCKVATSQKGDSLKYGFVHYEGEESAIQAIQRVDGKVISGEKVTVSAFKSRKERGVNGKNTFTNIYVKNVPDTFDDAKLRELFVKYGSITSCTLSIDKDGKGRGFGFVNFENPDEAQAAAEELNGLEVDDKKLFVDRAQKKEEREKELRERFEQLKMERQKKYAGVNLYVKNLSDQINDEKLREEFVKFGAIVSARVMMDNAGKSKGFGFVCFSSPEEATKAVTDMNGRMLDSKPLYVALAQRKDVRRQQLEAQYASRVKGMGGPGMQPQMFQPGPPGGPPPMGFYPGVPQRNFVYPTQQMMGGWRGGPGQQQAAGGMMGHPGFQLMPINQRGGGGGGRGGGRGGRGGGQARGNKTGGQQGPPNVKYAENVRNRDQRPMPQAQAQPQPEPAMAEALTTKALAEAPDEQRKQMIGERLFPLIKDQLVKVNQGTSAGKITGMLLEMDNGELLHLIENGTALKDKVDEALRVLADFQGAE